jgi:hypothetical protein
MKPRDILARRIEQDLRVELEAVGFSWAASRLTFRRRIEGAAQKIAFSLGKWNSDDNCAFWTMWSVSSAEYSRWHRMQFGEKPTNDLLAGLADWNIPGWTFPASKMAHLRNARSDAAVMQEVSANIFHAGIPFIQSVSTWRGAAERIISERCYYARAVDFLILASDYERARETLALALHRYASGEQVDQFHELELLRQRQKKFFP